ncbi:MAG TPA: hypothetical protein VIL70_04210, partial [Chthoniobacterales bacterium]
ERPLWVSLRRTITSAVSPLFIQLQKKPCPASTAALRQERPFADERRIAGFDPLRKFGSEFSMTGVDRCCRKIRFFAYRYGLSIEMHRQLLLKQS